MDISFEDESEFDVHHDLNQLESDIFSSQKQDRTFLEFFEPLPEKKLINTFSNIADKDKSELLSGTHSKYASDNVKNKIKTQFHKFAIQFYVDYLKNKLHVKNLTFRKIARNYTKNITISENKALMSMTMGELLNYDVLKKYRNDYYLRGNKEELVNNYGLKKAKLFADFLDEKRKTESQEYISILDQEAKGYVNYYLTKKPRTRRAKKTKEE